MSANAPIIFTQEHMDGLDGVLHAGCSTGHQAEAIQLRPRPLGPHIRITLDFSCPVYPTCFLIMIMPTS